MLAGWGGELGGVGYGESRMGELSRGAGHEVEGAWGLGESGGGIGGAEEADAVRGAMSVEAVGLAGVDSGGAEARGVVRGARSGEAAGWVGVDFGGAE